MAKPDAHPDETESISIAISKKHLRWLTALVIVAIVMTAVATSYNFLAVPFMQNQEINREKAEREETIEAAYLNSEAVVSNGTTINDVSFVDSFEEAEALPHNPRIKKIIDNPSIEADSHQFIIVDSKEFGTFLTLMIKLNGEWRLFIP